MRVFAKWFFSLMVYVAVGLCASQALAANGKISGVVTDRSSGEAIPGANVTTAVGGATVGATTDANGRYFLLNLAPGIYAVKASIIGYGPVEKTAVRVRQDLTTQVDFALAEQSIQAEAITVVAERPLVEKSLTSSRTSIDVSEINNTMPVTDLADLIDTSPSVFRGFVPRRAQVRIENIGGWHRRVGYLFPRRRRHQRLEPLHLDQPVTRWRIWRGDQREFRAVARHHLGNVQCRI